MKLSDKLPKKTITTSHTTLHCLYWAHAAVADISIMTPVYGALFVLTLMMHLIAEENQ